MNNTELQELRDWAARIIGEIIENPDSPRWCQKYTPGLLVERVDDWRPDENYYQCFMLVERMRELGWVGFDLRRGCVSGNWTSLFSKGENGVWLAGPETANPCLAILKAAKATGDKR